MPRQPRYAVPDVPQHVIQRGNNRQAVFLAERDYQVYLDKLKTAADRNGCDVHAWVLMTNHVHLLVTPRKADAVSKTMQSLGRTYVAYINRTHQRTGTLWEGRYRASLIDSDHYLLACYRYIELNPVRAGMVDRPDAYRWSSYRANATGAYDPLTTAHERYLALASDAGERQAAYRALFGSTPTAAELGRIRTALNQSQVLGSERFKDMIEAQLHRRVRPGRPGRPRKSNQISGSDCDISS